MKEYFKRFIQQTIRVSVRTGAAESAIRDILAVLVLLNRESRKELEQVMIQELKDQDIPEQEIQRIIAAAKEDGKEWFNAYEFPMEERLDPETNVYHLENGANGSCGAAREAE